MSEKNFWHLLRTSLPLKMYRVENRVMKGMPDIHYIHKGKTGWIELKYMHKLPVKRFTSGFKLNQCYWALNYRANKGQTWILIRVVRDLTVLINGKHAKILFDRPSTKKILEISSWVAKGNISDKQWDELAKVILS